MELGAARLRSVVTAGDGTVLASALRHTGTVKGPDAVVELVLDHAAELTRRHAPAAVGLAVPGTLAEATGTCVRATALGWREVPVRRWLAEELGLPVAVGHEAGAGALAESHRGTRRTGRPLLFVSVGSGIGAAVVRGGRAADGARDGGPGHAGGLGYLARADDLGHLVAEPGGAPCACGAAGCLETVVTDRAVSRAYHRATGQAKVPAAEVRRRAGAGDRAAALVRDRAVDRLATVLGPALAQLGPERLVIGGEWAAAGRAHVDALRSALAGRPPFDRTPLVHPARLGRRAGVLGAALLARRHLAAVRPARPERPQPPPRRGTAAAG